MDRLKMQHILLTGFLTIMLLVGCSSALTAPQPTQTTLPTKALPSLVTTLPTFTLTLTPSETAQLTRTPTLTRTPKPTKTPKPKEVNGCLAPAGTSGPTAPFKIENLTPRKVTVYINGSSRNGDFPIYCTEVVKQGVPVLINLMWGNYKYLVQYTGRTTRTGTFFINDFDNGTMLIFSDKIKIGPYP